MNNPIKLTILLVLIFILSILASSFTLYSQSLRLDEAQSIWVAAKSTGELLNLIGHDVHVPLYFLILHFWMQLFGTSVFVTRSLSLLFFILSLFAVYKLVSEVSNKKLAILTTSLFSLSPFIVWYASEIRMYTLFILVSSLQSFYFIKFFRSGAQSGRFWLFITTLLGFFTHYFFVFQVAAQLFFLLSRFMGKLTFRFLLIASGAFLFLVPWLIYVYTLGSLSNTQPLIPQPSTYNLFQTFVNFLFGFQPQNVQASLVSLWPLAVLILFFVFTKKADFYPRPLDYFIMLTFLPVIMVFITSFVFKPLFLSRYLIFVTPNLFLILAWILFTIVKKRVAVVSGFLLFLSLSALVYQNTSAYSPIREDYLQVSKYLNQKTTAKDIVVVSSPFTIYPIEYYYRGSARVDTIPAWDRLTKGGIPTYSRQKLVAQINSYKSYDLRIFVVLSYDQGYEKDIRDYLDKNTQLLGLQRFSPGLEVRVYRLRYDVAVPALK